MNDQKKSLDLLGLFKFSVTTFFFITVIVMVLKNAVAVNSIGMILTTSLTSLLALVGLKNEFENVQTTNKKVSSRFTFSEKVKVSAIFTIAAIATYLLAVHLDINTFFSGSIITLLMVYLIPAPFDIFQGTVYTGTFAGMVSNQFIPSWSLALLFGFIASLMFLFFQPSYPATGGSCRLKCLYDFHDFCLSVF